MDRLALSTVMGRSVVATLASDQNQRKNFCSVDGRLLEVNQKRPGVATRAKGDYFEGRTAFMAKRKPQFTGT